MSIQAGWNQMLITAGALGKLGEQNKLHEYNTVKELQGRLRSTLDPIHKRQTEEVNAQWEAGTDAMLADTDNYEDAVKKMDETAKVVDELGETHKEERSKALTELSDDLAVNMMPRSLKRHWEKAQQGYLQEYERKDNEYTADLIGNLWAKAYSARARSQMAAQRAQDAAQAADMQPKNSMSPIIEQLRRNTQNAVKGGTK